MGAYGASSKLIAESSKWSTDYADYTDYTD